MDMTKFLEIPFEWGGRSFKGCDCYGFIRLVLLDLGKTVPIFPELHNWDDETEFLESSPYFSETDEPETGDMVHLVSMGSWAHAGIYLEGLVWDMTCTGVKSRNWRRIFPLVKGIYHVQG